MAVRIQRRRTAGYRLPEGAVYVGRPTRWGNMFKVGDFYASRTWAHNRPEPRGQRAEPGTYWHEGMTFGPWVETVAVVRDRAHAVELFAAYIAYEDVAWGPARIRAELGGRDLACWCKLPTRGEADYCHAAVLLELVRR